MGVRGAQLTWVSMAQKEGKEVGSWNCYAWYLLYLYQWYLPWAGHVTLLVFSSMKSE